MHNIIYLLLNLNAVLAYFYRQEKLQYRARVEAHRKQKEENAKKSEVVQVVSINNLNKIIIY